VQPVFSVIIPAYNEEQYLPATLAAVNRAAERLAAPVEIIVVDNLSTDRTREVAREFGARVVSVPTKCISAVRNGGAATATGQYLVFVDADNQMSEDLLIAVKEAMDTGKYVGGGLVNAHYDRDSLGLRFTHGLVKVGVALTGVSMFLMYTSAEHFHAIGGFDENLLSTEDHDFAKRLRAHGKANRLAYLNLRKGHVILSSRKFDEYGDWTIFNRPIQWLRACLNDRDTAYEFWYKPRREKATNPDKEAA